jgi:hypothetical protein
VECFHASSVGWRSSAGPSDKEPNDEGVNLCGCHGNWYHWRPGDYTLMSDADDSDGFVLETRLYFNCDGKLIH